MLGAKKKIERTLKRGQLLLSDIAKCIRISNIRRSAFLHLIYFEAFIVLGFVQYHVHHDALRLC